MYLFAKKTILYDRIVNKYKLKIQENRSLEFVKEENLRDMVKNDNCPCKKKKCERHGDCDACRKHHAESKHQRPVYCERKKK